MILIVNLKLILKTFTDINTVMEIGISKYKFDINLLLFNLLDLSKKNLNTDHSIVPVIIVITSQYKFDSNILDHPDHPDLNFQQFFH